MLNLSELNNKQKEAVTTTQGPLLILAGAGSGKTRVITYRFAYLLEEQNLFMNNILAVTFTNKAAKEMQERIATLTGKNTKLAWIRTFHSMCVWILRKHIDVLGYNKQFIIYDQTDSQNLVKSIIKDFNLAADKINYKNVYYTFSQAKDNLISPLDFQKNANSYLQEQIAKIYIEYEKRLFQNQALDFNDLILKTITLLEEHHSIREYYQNLWKYIMIDEFQDTNDSQYHLMELLCNENKNICVVGDDDQSIYGWRGANVENISTFHKQFNAKVIRLEQNYRSTSTILEAANSIVDLIPNRMEKKLWSEKKTNDKIEIHLLQDHKTEAEKISTLIQNLIYQKKYSYQDFAILYRTNAQSRIIEQTLTKNGIPCSVYGGQAFFKRKEIKDLLAYIRFILNPFDTESFKRIINIPKRGVGATTIDKLLSYKNENNTSCLDVFSHLDELPHINKNTKQSLFDFSILIQKLNSEINQKSPYDFINLLIEDIDYKHFLEINADNFEDRWNNIEELVNSVYDFMTEHNEEDCTIENFLLESSLASDLDESSDINSVNLMTVHSAKGLEFPVVFVAGLMEDLFPLGSAKSEEERWEEYRLFYVAVTRAKDLLFLTHSRLRISFGNFVSCSPSCFLSFLPKTLILEKKERAINSYGDHQNFVRKSHSSSYTKDHSKEKLNLATINNVKTQKIKNISDLNVKDKVLYRPMGIGNVVYIGTNMIQIDFENYGKKGIMLSNLSSIEKVI